MNERCVLKEADALGRNTQSEIPSLEWATIWTGRDGRKGDDAVAAEE